MYEYLLNPVVLRYPQAAFLQNPYIFSAIILFIAAVLAKLLLVVFGKYLQRFAKHTKTDFDDLILERIKRPFFYLILAQGLKLSLYNLQINGVVSQIVDSLMALVFIFILARVLNIVIDVWGKTFAKKTETKLDEVLLPLLHKFSKVVFVIVAIMWVLHIWNIDITPYLAGAGIAGIVFGLALQDALKNVLGGAATYAAISSSNFVKTGLIAVVGEDFSKKNHNILSKYLDLQGLTISKGKTFRYDGKYDNTLSTRSTLKTELNVLGDFKPIVPDEYKKSQFVYLANNDPEQNTKLIKEFDNVKFSMCDTIDFWISTKRSAVIKMIKNVDAVVINDEEAKLLTKEHNLIKCAKKMKQWEICASTCIISEAGGKMTDISGKEMV